MKQTHLPKRSDIAARRRPAAWAAAIAVAAVWAAFIGLRLGAGRDAGWLLRGLTSRLSLVCCLVMTGCLAALFVLGAGMWRAGRAERLRRRAAGGRDDRGTVILEFAMVLPFALMIVLMMIQSAMLMAGNLCVHYAAYCAARTAIVAIPDGARQPDHTLPPDGEGPNVLGDYRYSGTEGEFDKAGRIWRAAVWAVMPVSSGSPDVPSADAGDLVGGLQRFFAGYGMDSPWWTGQALARRLGYAIDYTAVDVFSPASGGKYAQNEDVTVRVEHVFYLGVPYARRVFSLLEGGRELDFGAGERGTLITARCTLTNEGVQDYVEEEPLLAP